MTNIKDVFENKLKIDSKTVSIDSLFNNEDKLNNTNFTPSYQRNYVWDDEKATYFIESILLGTEIPPLIYFRNISKVEVIDGRQRYQTILRFLNNEFKLKRSGLKKLISKDFVGKNFESLGKKYKDLIWETKLRIIEFGFNTKEGITEIVEDTLKKEIFKRYNSGITPLKTNEIDKAEFLYDDVNQYFKSEVISDKVIYSTLRALFHFEKFNEEVLLKKIRELLVIDKIPIKYFSKKKSNVINQFYEYLYEDISVVDVEELRNTFITKINLIDKIYKNIEKKDQYSRLISECLFWALSIFHSEKGHLNITAIELDKIREYIEVNIAYYEIDRSSFAIHIKNRYENISKIFTELYGINFNVYLKDSEVFEDQVNDINNSADDNDVISFEDLRINKPEPSSTSIDDIIRSMKRQKFIIRPQYQRNEVIDKKKASSIIESILLGIKIPPIFVYKNTEGVSEVIDGQQRLLTILGFLGENFINTENEYESSKKDDYSLNLKNSILSNLTSKKFKDLDPEYQEKIKNYDLWVIEIDAKYNEKFDPVDLFIRLNYKPYPIKIDSFEMWNSYISRDLIDTIKDVYRNNKEWFYFRKSTTRMENENILTALIYLYYQFENAKDKSKRFDALDYYKVGNKINFRLRSKPDLTKTLENESKNLIYISNLFEADFLDKLQILIEYIPQKNLALSLDYLLCVDNGRRTQQSLYALWFFVSEISIDRIKNDSTQIISEIRALFSQMNNVTHIDEFNTAVRNFKEKFCKTDLKSCVHRLRLEDIAKVHKGVPREFLALAARKDTAYAFIHQQTSFQKQVELEYFRIETTEENLRAIKKIFEGEILLLSNFFSLEHFDLYLKNEQENYLVTESSFAISRKRSGILYEYLYLLLASKIVHRKTLPEHKKITTAQLNKITVPVLSEKHQVVFQKLFQIILNEDDTIKKTYFVNICNSLFDFLLTTRQSILEETNIQKILDYLSDELSENGEGDRLYTKLSSVDSPISTLVLRMNYLFRE